MVVSLVNSTGMMKTIAIVEPAKIWEASQPGQGPMFTLILDRLLHPSILLSPTLHLNSTLLHTRIVQRESVQDGSLAITFLRLPIIIFTPENPQGLTTSRGTTGPDMSVKSTSSQQASFDDSSGSTGVTCI